MYGISLDMEPRRRTNPGLQEYARAEYGSKDYAWFLASTAASGRKPARRAFAFRLRLRRVRAPPRPVACKGSPRFPPTQAPSLN